MRKLVVFSCLFLFLSVCNSLLATVITFDDLSPRQEISGTYYQGLYWEYGNSGAYNVPGSWICPVASNPSQNYYNYPERGRNIANGYGCTEIAIQFLKPVDVIEAHFSAQGFIDYWTTGVQVFGYLNNQEAGQTNKFTNIGSTPDLFVINLKNVDRIVIKCDPVTAQPPLDPYGIYGYYGMDNLTFHDTTVPEPTSLLLLGLGAVMFHKSKK